MHWRKGVFRIWQENQGKALWMLHPWWLSRSSWMGHLATWSSECQPCPRQEIGTRWPLRSLSTQAIYVPVYDCMKYWSMRGVVKDCELWLSAVRPNCRKQNQIQAMILWQCVAFVQGKDFTVSLHSKLQAGMKQIVCQPSLLISSFQVSQASKKACREWCLLYFQQVFIFLFFLQLLPFAVVNAEPERRS